MNIIFFDLTVCQPSKESKFHGGGVYGYIVLRDLLKKAPNRLVIYYRKSAFIVEDVMKSIIDNNVKTIDADIFSLKDAYFKSDASLLYTPLYSLNYLPLINTSVNCIVTIHGLRSIECFTDKNEKKYFFKPIHLIRYYKRLLTERVKHNSFKQYENVLDRSNVTIVTVSNHSKYSIKAHFPKCDESKLHVMYSPSTTIPEFNSYKKEKDKKYFLIISANRWIKNAYAAISALDNILEYKPSICDEVIVLGLNKETKVYKEIRNKDRFRLLGYQTQEQLENLYAGAYAFMYPTLNEGFGYPPLEAMKYGVPVITTAFSSIPEICGDAVLYANPYDVKEIENRVLQLEDVDFYELYVKKSLERYSIITERQHDDLSKLTDLILGKK